MSYVRLVLVFTREKGLTTPLNCVVISEQSSIMWEICLLKEMDVA